MNGRHTSLIGFGIAIVFCVPGAAGLVVSAYLAHGGIPALVMASVLLGVAGIALGSYVEYALDTLVVKRDKARDE